MMRNALMMLAGGTALVFAAPVGAQAAGQGAAAQTPAAQPGAPAAATTATAPATADDPAAKATDPKADAKAKTKGDSASSCGTVVKAGPNQGQVVGKCKKDAPAADATKAKDSDQPH